MSTSNQELLEIVSNMAHLLETNEIPDPHLYAAFIQHPELSFQLIDLINTLDEEKAQDDFSIYSAAIFALDLCIAQLQNGAHQNKVSAKNLEKLMHHMAETINLKKHTISFWLPALNAFYETQVELTPELKDAYFELASDEDDLEDYDEENHLDSIKDLITDLSDLSVFDITENIFAQSYAMPPEFFSDLVLDLYSIEEGQDIALLTLLHPSAAVREVIVFTIDQVIDNIVLTPQSLSRLKSIMHWYPASFHAQFNRWIKIQRKKGVVFGTFEKADKISIKATEVDGGGSQGVFIHEQTSRKNRLAGLLYNDETGLKDAWMTPVIPAVDVKRYYHEAFDDSVTLREVDKKYLQKMTEHFLALTVEQGNAPDLHLLEIQEITGIQFMPQKINADQWIEQLGVQITPFTQETFESSLKRSKSWPSTKQFTESWFEENYHIDKIVNRHCSIANGVKACNFDAAMNEVFEEEFEAHRDKWLFHFLWISFWLKVKSRENEKTWQDSFFIAYAIHQGYPLDTIPVMHEICYQSVVNSVETMQERRTHLSKE